MSAQPPLQPTPEARAFSYIKTAANDSALLAELLPNLTDRGKERMYEAGLTPDGAAGVVDTLNLLNDTLAAQRPPQPTPEACAVSFIQTAANDPALLAELLPKVTDRGKERMAAAGLTSDGAAVVPEMLTFIRAEITGAPEFIKAQTEALNIQKKNPDLKETMEVFSALKNALSSNIAQTSRAYGRTMWMYMISFYLGVALVIAAVVFAWLGDKKPLFPSLFGGLGMASIMTFFFTKPPERLQSSRASLAQLQCALLSWYTDFFNSQLILMQQNIGDKLGSEAWKKSAEEYLHRTDTWMKMLQRAVQQASDNTKGDSKTDDPAGG